MNGCAALIARERVVPDAFPDDVRTRWASGRAVQAEDSAERIDELADAAPAADRERPPMMLGSRIEKRLAMGAQIARRDHAAVADECDRESQMCTQPSA
ncbi:hypothetical protein AA983_03775 [Dermacoccus sp. PE3]|nr:hypothetical protein AA983_03775 [Dermacoccus sp. PE3]